jgi:hypothetical protein
MRCLGSAGDDGPLVIRDSEDTISSAKPRRWGNASYRQTMVIPMRRRLDTAMNDPRQQKAPKVILADGFVAMQRNCGTYDQVLLNVSDNAM